MVPEGKVLNNKNRKTRNRLTVNEKILLHLLENLKSKNQREAPKAITQMGIADSVQIRWNHVPRAMVQLKKMGYISEDITHIEGKTRRQKAYYLTDEGLLSAKNLREKLLNWDVFLKRADGQMTKLKLSRVNSTLKTNLSPLTIYMNLSDDDVIEEKYLLHGVQKESEKKSFRIFFSSGEISWPKEFINRESEITTLRNWINGTEYGTIVVFGSVGIGKSALVAEILRRYKDKKNIFWYQLSEEDTSRDIFNQLSEFLLKFGNENLWKYLKEHETIELPEIMRIMDRAFRDIEAILTFVNYFSVSEEVADLFSGLCDLAKKNKSIKIIVGAWDSTPFYCRFYDKSEVEEKRIAELTIKGLDREGIKKLLETPNIDSDALKKIDLLTRGHPLTIELIKKGDVNSLKRIKGFSRQEASLLLYLKGVEGT